MIDSQSERATASAVHLDQRWDAIVVGAGPAGSLTALQLAERGHKVLLVEAKSFPRDKVCGGCLNRRAWSVLAAHRIDQAITDAGAVELNRLRLMCGSRSVLWPLPTMMAVSRRTLDEILVAKAKERGASFAAETRARIVPADSGSDAIQVNLKHRDGTEVVVSAKVAIAADGLNHTSLGDLQQTASRVAPGSHIGLGATLPYAGDALPLGELRMVACSAGYVGLTRVEDGRLNIAVALAAARLKQSSPGEAVATMLSEAGAEVPAGCRDAAWQGTAPLTRESSHWSARRLFLVGDATGYVEPFTGEGMSWALCGAVEVSHFAERAIGCWSDDLAKQWHGTWRGKVRRNQITCRGLAWLLRRPNLAQWSLAAAEHAPWLPSWLMQRVAG